MNIRKTTVSVIAGVATLASASALAFDFDGIYVLGGVGVAGVNDSKFADNDDFTSFAGGDYPELEAKTDFAWRGGLGMWLTDSFALEFNYIGLKSETSSTNTVLEDNADVTRTAEWDLKTGSMSFFDVSLLGRKYVADQFWVFGRLGVAYARVSRTVDETETEVFHDGGGINEVLPTQTVLHEDEGAMGAAVGVGAQYDFTPMFGVRLEASTIQALNNDDMYAVTGNLVVNFGELM
jgi:opacity protein-like surface antigen